MKIGFEKISPTPKTPKHIDLKKLLSLRWDDKNDANVNDFKKFIKPALRNLQKGRCCYCRRQLSDDVVTDIEHIVEKEQFPDFSFEILNLSLSCKTCNFAKNKSNRSLLKEYKNALKADENFSIVLKQTLNVHSPYPSASGYFRWVHPHFDKFSDHICIEKNFIYKEKTDKGGNTIIGADLNAIHRIEMRALEEKLSSDHSFFHALLLARDYEFLTVFIEYLKNGPNTAKLISTVQFFENKDEPKLLKGANPD